jgi:hypothetical protein
MRRAFRVPCDANLDKWFTDMSQIVEVKDWLRNKNDYRVFEADLTDSEAVELMLSIDGAVPTITFDELWQQENGIDALR